ncbi:MAG: hypothetical protein GY820_10415 [Gammaproteobacteria bacterium]|nr:hypothetical protein [Gammaproteobacteria bacterium]
MSPVDPRAVKLTFVYTDGTEESISVSSTAYKPKVDLIGVSELGPPVDYRADGEILQRLAHYLGNYVMAKGFKLNTANARA